MLVLIGHASISEKGTVNGNKGDSTGKEVCFRYWYNKGWGAVLRPKTPELAENSAKACEDGCKNDNIGYGQGDRNTAYQSFKKVGSVKKIEKSNTDCSAFMTLCAIAGGCSALNYSGNAPTTSTMVNQFKATGQYEVLTDSKYLTSDAYLKRGDILVKAGSHTVMVLSNGSKVNNSTPKATNPYKEPSAVIKKGSHGEGVKWVQWELNQKGAGLVVDGDAGSKTDAAIRKYQKAHGLVVDGQVGKLTRQTMKND